jgi:hypothetical protein
VVPPSNTAATEEYDGTSWATSPVSLSTARPSLGGAGTQASALAFAGNTTRCFSNSNRRMDRSRSINNKNNYNKLIGGKYGTYKNIHRS